MQVRHSARSHAPDGSVTAPQYNRAGFLERALVTTGGQSRAVVHSMAYNEKGQRIVCEYSEQTATGGNPAYRTTYTYDPETFRLRRLLTQRASDGVLLQNLTYSYDPVGNITEVQDDGSPVPIFANPIAEVAHGLYEYDALYRLIRAEGREHPGQQVTHDDSASELGRTIPHANDTSTLIRYSETYDYDGAGNILRMHHQPLASGHEAWERRYLYAYAAARANPSMIPSNRLLSTSITGDAIGTYSATYEYSELAANNAGLHGSMTRMPHLPAIHWDYLERMARCETTAGAAAGTVYFSYDANGERVRKTWIHSGLREERIYLAGFETYRRTRGTGTAAVLEVHRTTLHVVDEQRRVAMAENTITDVIDGLSGTRWRFQLDNHLGSTAIEVDDSGLVISYEEYHPFGTSALRVQQSAAGLSQKRYRYTGKERDAETSLYYHGARYYAPWLGRWTAADLAGTVDGLNLYRYSRDNPIRFSDPGGTQSAPSAEPTWRDRLSSIWRGIVKGAHVAASAAGNAEIHRSADFFRMTGQLSPQFAEIEAKSDREHEETVARNAPANSDEAIGSTIAQIGIPLGIAAAEGMAAGYAGSRGGGSPRSVPTPRVAPRPKAPAVQATPKAPVRPPTPTPPVAAPTPAPAQPVPPAPPQAAPVKLKVQAHEARDPKVEFETPSVSSGTPRAQLARVPDFASPKLAAEHYAKHARGVIVGKKGALKAKPGGADTPEFGSVREYVAAARAFHSGAPGEGVLEGVRKNGDIVRFDPKTGYFGIRTQNGVIRTFFRPEGDAAARMSYFRDQFK